MWSLSVADIMNVGLQTWGTEGDVRPFIALAASLVQAGHSASLSVTEIMNGNYSSYGERFGFQLMHPGHIDVSPGEYASLGSRLVAAKNPALKSGLLVDNFLNPSLDSMYETALELCRGCDVAVGHIFAYSLRAAALKTDTPWIALYTTPIIPSNTVAAPGFPDLFHRMGWRGFSKALDILWKPDMDEFYRERGLAAPEGVFKDVFHSEHLNLVATSPALYPGGGVPGYRFCGSMEIPARESVFLTDRLKDFLAGGDPPVFITFGSMYHGEESKEDFVSLIVDSVKAAGCRAVVQSEDSYDEDRVHFTGRVPHHLIFPRCSAVVHHGGCGTSHAACAAGVPSVVVEYTSDQPMWGMLLKKAGVAPETLHRRSLSSKRLSMALEKVLKNPVFRENSLSLAEKMKNDKGADEAASHIIAQFGG